ncbi:Cu+-exporting ATPase [Myroides marinus]|uniref:Cu+-exporting ATPase n=1 Tax=Myroides marinus TaxID=703342 RepID=A0A1H6UE47_9FLAO|nr:HAD-IC family P-type ATPase [Myroides marinus]SEI87937.1 Cu+-exporting ATPase [Myroides marinus]
MSTITEQKNNTLCQHCQGVLEQQDSSPFCGVPCSLAYTNIKRVNLLEYYSIGKTNKNKPKLSETNQQILANSLFENLIITQTNTDYSLIVLIKNLDDQGDLYLLERLHLINAGIINSLVNIKNKTLEVVLDTDYKIHSLITLLGELGYLVDTTYQPKQQTKDPLKPLITRLGIAGFCFGNVMMLSLPEYFDTGELWLQQNKNLFRILNMLLTTVAIIGAAQGYFKSALSALAQRSINMDVPISLGISVIYLRSSFDVLFGLGSGYFDSVCGLIFFLLIGKYAQSKVYTNLQYDRDYKDYFPISVTKIVDNQYINTALAELVPGDNLLIRNNEIIPADAIARHGSIYVDYSFITGESLPVLINENEKVLAGAKLIGANISITLISSVNQSYLTQLWNNTSIEKENLLSDKSKVLAKYFTTSVLFIALFAFVFWMVRDSTKAFHVLTSILVIACPCALALSIPFTYGFGTRILSNYQFYLANPNVIEQISQVDTLVFDKTGTLTSNDKTQVSYHGKEFSSSELEQLTTILRSSNHPLSKIIVQNNNTLESKKQVQNFKEVTGQGIIAVIDKHVYKIGSASFLGQPETEQTQTHISIDQEYYGKYVFYTNFRIGIDTMFQNLKNKFNLHILSGDNTGQKQELELYLKGPAELHFNQSPTGKLSYIQQIQREGNKVVMLGDGLNDAGALKQSHVGISVTEDTNNFSPACDVILLANKLKHLPLYINFSKGCVKIVKQAWAISLTYNTIGISLAVMGLITPLFSAILMPISSISVLVFTKIKTSKLQNKVLIPINN